MSRPEFTPAPWRAIGATVHAVDGTVIARVRGGLSDDEEVAQATARLIAMSPRLYGSVRKLIARLAERDDLTSEEAAALAEALAAVHAAEEAAS